MSSGCKKKLFTCFHCGLNVDCNHFGKSPRKEKNILFLEEAYSISNPFNDEGFLVVGSHCSVCGVQVCVNRQCSLFYSKRFCKSCACTNKEHFPAIIQKDIQHHFIDNS